MLRLSLTCGVVVAALVSSASAQEPKPIRLWLTPAKPPTPALRYQLLPDARILISGDAAPLYKQVIELLAKKGFINQKAELFDSWAKLPLDQLPKEAVRKELAEYDDVFELLDKAARCDHCDWGLLDRLREKGIGALIPEFQPLRRCALLLSVRVRLEMAEGHFDKATVTLRNGFALAQHSGETEMLITFLVGTATAAIMYNQLDEFVAQPGAPNLYYALADLPVPLLSMRKALQGERIAAYGTFPGLAAVGADLNAGNLTDQQLAACAKVLTSAGSFPAVNRTALAALILSRQTAAKKALIDAGRPRDKVEAMTPVQVALLHALLEYDTSLDEMIVWDNLPYWEQADRQGALMKRLRAERLRDPNSPAIPLAPLFLPAVQRITFARVRTTRKIALLRTIEAIRYYAALHDGQLPPTLADIKEVPLPLDPVTGKSFTYRLDGATATLRAPPPAKEMPNSSNSVIYELQIRQGKER